MNLCGACGVDFASVAAFDRHRVGRHAYSFLEGMHLEPPQEDGRRCLDEGEMRQAGMEVDARGRWHVTADVERIRAHARECRSVVRIPSRTPAERLFDPELGVAAVGPITERIA